MKRNIVAKHARKFNKARVEEDRKKKKKRGYEKHRGSLLKKIPLFVYNG